MLAHKYATALPASLDLSLYVFDTDCFCCHVVGECTRAGHLMTTLPKRLRPGCPGVLLVNRARSDTLGECQHLQLVAGFNMEW